MDSGLSSRNNMGGHQMSRSYSKQDGSKQQSRQALPIYSVRKSLMELIRKSPTTIVLGETGSGKTTQMPQFIYEAGLNGDKMIGVTQPRRVAAITVAKWVAMETGSNLGEQVGYTVRFEDVTSENTQIKYMTDGILCREALSDRQLRNYNVIILDEVHERTVSTDILLGIVKKAQQTRAAKRMSPLKVIIMSATMDCDHFASYFSDCPIVYLQGRTYQVKVYQMVEKMHYIEACLKTVVEIHQSHPAGDILVFLTGQEEIDATVNKMRRLAKFFASDLPKLAVYPMYAALPQTQQLDVFNPAPANVRKVIFATNIAETSITINGIRYVVDCGRAKVRTYDPITGLDMLKVQWASQAQAHQRTGRAGRVTDGICFRTYTRSDYERMDKMTVPEILRCNLASTILHLLVLGVSYKDFEFIDRPPEEAIVGALLELKALNAISSVENPILTALGSKMARFPLDPKYSKMLLAAPKFGCLEEMLTIVAMLSGETIFTNSTQKREQMLIAHSKFYDKTGDHITLLKVFNEFKTKSKPKMWCFDNFLHERNLTHVASVREQLSEICKSLEMPSSSCGKDTIPVAKCLLTGLFANVATKQPDHLYVTATSSLRARIHPSSAICGKFRPAMVVYTELVATRLNYLRYVTEIEPEWYEEVVPSSVHQSGTSESVFRAYATHK
ncbi:ATP-dependent RNA helicase DHX33 [Anopheles aquasalis]|uniref:ATP-dependent RNA helicase DHX33 n=1 Tax=Anopheles aquasalis TaxID=42839 RepID=UPI00215A92D5|nr:ATP-dependent RNA helicase DHX33 [Anopheles aquasalis]